VRAQRVAGDQHGISVKVAATRAGYRLGVVDGSPYLALLSPATPMNTPSAATEFPASVAAQFSVSRRRRARL